MTNNLNSNQPKEIRGGMLGSVLRACRKQKPSPPPVIEEEPGHGVPKTLIASLLAIGILTSRPAHAGWMEDLSKQLTQGITNAIKPVFEQFTKLLSGDFSSIFEQTTDKVSVAIGGMTDMIGKTITDTENKRIKEATKPAPDECGSDLIAKDMTKADQQSSVNRVKLSVESTNRVIKANPSIGRVKLKEIMKNNGGSIPAASLQLGTIVNKPNLTTTDEISRAKEYHSILTGPTEYVGSEELIGDLFKINEDPVAQDRQASMLSKTLRLQVASAALLDPIADRDASSGKPSKIGLMAEQIDRRYGDNGEAWRKEINECNDATPLLKNLLREQAFTNKLLYEQLIMSEKGNSLLGVIILEQMDFSKNSNINKESI
ncbi:hypothetical protein ACK32R_04210 [Aeromonas dhakensis]|jgi:hypothetical protein|uniref:hypothetical protein n=1 Tax=Aeromonas dhakensis TaxID=196024 RepID=UPI003987BE98